MSACLGCRSIAVDFNNAICVKTIVGCSETIASCGLRFEKNYIVRHDLVTDQESNQLLITKVAIFMNFKWMTSSCSFNRGAAFPQMVNDKVLFATFPKMRTFRFQSRCRPNNHDRVKISRLKTPGSVLYYCSHGFSVADV